MVKSQSRSTFGKNRAIDDRIDPGRDPRGWTVTIIPRLYLPSRALDLVQAGDDAKDVVFVGVDFQTGKNGFLGEWSWTTSIRL